MTTYTRSSNEVFVYKNLHKKCFSLRNTTTRRVAGNHKTTVYLRDAKFKVSEYGRQEVIKTKRKMVHAGVQGVEISEEEFLNQVSYTEDPFEVVYNPYKFDSFVGKFYPRRVDFASFVKLEHNDMGSSKIFAYNVG